RAQSTRGAEVDRRPPRKSDVGRAGPHVDGTARMAFDDDGAILAADINFTQDVGAYPTPYRC
ncbi:xanthine dehydrogenase, molybdenum binding subunit apo domain protein, partial [Mycobacterium xenopi 3993]